MKAFLISFLICFLAAGAYAEPYAARGSYRTASPEMVRVSGFAPQRRGSATAQVTKTTFSRYAGNRGIWRGLVGGDGKIHLTLKILRGGLIESTRYIGSVLQHRWEKPTPFVFTAALPKGSGWSWLIVAEES